MIPIYEPYLTEDCLRYSHDAITSGWISNIGEYKNKSINELVRVLEIENCILVNNGTSATHLLYKALKNKKPDLKNILVPNNVYVAAWNSMLFDNDDINLIPVQTDIETWNVDVKCLIEMAKKHNSDDTAILIVHNLGNIINVPLIKRSLPEYEIIEDNCEGLFGKYENRYSGSAALASSVSFYGNKTITCGEGGAVLFNDNDLHEMLLKMHSQGQTEKRYLHDVKGYNYRMTNVQAAILYGQLKEKNTILNKKKKIFDLYKEILSSFQMPNIVFRNEQPQCENANWMFPIRIKNKDNQKHANKYFRLSGIEIRNMFYPMSCHKHLAAFSNPLIEREDNLLAKEVIILPSSPNLTENQVEYICNQVALYNKTLKTGE